MKSPALFGFRFYGLKSGSELQTVSIGGTFGDGWTLSCWANVRYFDRGSLVSVAHCIILTVGKRETESANIAFGVRQNCFHLLKDAVDFPLLFLKGIYYYWMFFSPGVLTK